MNLRLSAVKPLWVFTVMTLSEVGRGITAAGWDKGFTVEVCNPTGVRQV